MLMRAQEYFKKVLVLDPKSSSVQKNCIAWSQKNYDVLDSWLKQHPIPKEVDPDMRDSVRNNTQDCDIAEELEESVCRRLFEMEIKCLKDQREYISSHKRELSLSKYQEFKTKLFWRFLNASKMPGMQFASAHKKSSVHFYLGFYGYHRSYTLNEAEQEEAITEARKSFLKVIPSFVHYHYTQDFIGYIDLLREHHILPVAKIIGEYIGFRASRKDIKLGVNCNS